MCGLVGVAGNVIARDVTLFSQMLMADELRGKHATGITRVVKNQNDMFVGHAKLALAASFFRHLPIFDMITSPTLNLTALMGHNRHATKGASDQHKNAHPFEHGHINLMHNGSLTTHHSLTKGTFTVDSEAICAAFREDGALEVIPKLRGAFALCWTDKEQQTLNFVRNDERPLHIAVNRKSNKIYWASEKDMLKWLLDRDMTFATGGFDYDDIEELPVGELWSYPLLPNSANVANKTVTPVEVYEAPTYVGYNYGTGGYQSPTKKSQSGGSESGTVANKTSKASTGTNVVSTTNQLLGSIDNNLGTNYLFSDSLEKKLEQSSKLVVERLGLTYAATRAFVQATDSMTTNLEERVAFYVTGFETYTGSVNSSVVKGKIMGRMVEYPFSEVVVHAAKRTKYVELIEKADAVGTAFVSGVQCDVSVTGKTSLTDKECRDEVKLLLRADTVKQALDVTLFMFDDGQIPAEWIALATPQEVVRLQEAAKEENEAAIIAQKK